MSKIFQDAKDKNVAAVLVYKKTNQTKAYKDAELTVQYTTSELQDAFVKGAIIVLEDESMVKPIKFDVSSSIGSIYYIKPNGTTATSADIASLVSVADS
jgi:hypothetical protein